MPDFPEQPPAPPSKPPAQPGREEGEGTTVLERVPQKTEPPRLYQVLMLNDDFTPWNSSSWSYRNIFVMTWIRQPKSC